MFRNVFFKRHIIVLLFFTLLSFQGYSQLTLEIRDVQNDELLQGVSIGGLDSYDILDNGLVRFSESAYSQADSIIIFHHGYEQKVLYSPFSSSYQVVYLQRLSQNLDEVVITVDQSARALRKSPSSISYRSSDELLAHQAPVLNSQMNALPGVFMQSGTNNTNRLTIRGVGSRTPYSSNRIKAYLGDFPLTDGNGVTVLEDLPPDIIESVEVLKGPAATLYGSGPGGVVKINPRSLDNHTQVIRFSMQAGSFGSIKYAGGGMAKKGGFAAQGYFSEFKSNGYRENNRYKRQSFFFNARQKINKHTISLVVLSTVLYGQIPSSLSLEDYKENPQIAAQNWKDVEGYEKYGRLGINLSLLSILGEHFSNKLSANFRYNDPYEKRPFNILDETTHATEINNRFKYFTGDFQFTMIGRLMRENYRWATFEVDNPESLINEMTDRKMHFNGGLMAQWQPSENFIAKAGVSYNDVRYRLKNLQIEDAEFEDYRFNPVWSPSIGLNYEPTEKLNLFASVSHGFSPPSLEETLMPDGLVNTNLQPEKALMAEVGIRWSKFQWVNVNTTVYAMEIKDMLVTRRLAEDQFMGVNAGKVHHAGLEAEIILWPLQFLSSETLDMMIRSSVTHSVNQFVDFTDLDVKYDGNFLPGIPQYHWHNALSLKYQEKYSLHLDHSITGSQYMTDDN
ncbi:MAG: hypothetical protein C0599_04955, partial [Salinivirgaceae bacterium]